MHALTHTAHTHGAPLLPPPPGEAVVEFSFTMAERSGERRTNKGARQKAAPAERNLDGSLKVAGLGKGCVCVMKRSWRGR